MPPRKIILLVVAMVIALGTVLLARSMMSSAPQAPVETSSTEVLAAAHDLPIGTLIKEADLKWISWTTEADTGGLYVKGKTDENTVIGSVVRQSLREGEPLMSGHIVRPHEQGFLAAVLTPGKRAMAVAITPVAGVAGFIFPGDHVDVILAHQVERKDDASLTVRRVSETVLTDVRVLALDQKTSDQTTDPKIAQLATLEVTPKQAEKVALLTQLGTLSLVLRSLASETDTPAIPAIPADALLPDALPGAETSYTWDSDVSEVLPKPSDRSGLVQKVQVMRGKDTTETNFDRRH